MAPRTCTVYSLAGTEQAAELLVERELERIANRANGEEGSGQRGTEERIFTAYLWPADSEYDLRTLADDLIPIQFPWGDERLLKRTMAREVEGLYATSGRERAASLLGSISASADSYRLSLGADPDALMRNAVPFTSVSESMQAGNRVWVACDDALRELDARAEKVVADVQASAQAIGAKRLETAYAEVLTETVRYLDLGLERRATADEILGDDVRPSQVILRGPGTPGLLRALREIETRRRALDRAAADYALKEVDVKEGRRGEIARYGGLLHAPNMTAPVGPEEMAVSYPEVTAALEEAAYALALMVTVSCRSFPLVGRIWMRHRRFDGMQVEAAWNGEPAIVGKTAESSHEVGRLKESILETLRDTREGNRDFAAALNDDATRVWKYPPLVSTALDALAITDPSVEYRAAQERLDAEHALSGVSKIALANGALGMSASLLGAILPAVELGIACAGAVLTVLGLIEETLETLEQDDAYHAALDPSKALASEPGYRGLVVAIGFSLLDLKGVRDASRAVRFAQEAEAARVAAALEGATP